MEKIRWIETEMEAAERFIMNEDVERGLGIMENLLFEEPGYGPLHNHLGWAYLYYKDEKEKAELHLKAAIHFTPGYFAPYLHLGQCYLRKQQYDASIEVLRSGLGKENANRMAILETMANAYEMKGDFKRAIQTYKEGLGASMEPFEWEKLKVGVRRCRKKRWAHWFIL